MDDGSTDVDSKKLYSEFPHNVVYLGQQRGAAAAYNAALEQCRTPWFVLLDADDYLAVDYLERMHATAAAQQVEWVYCDSELIDEESAPLGRMKYPEFDAARLQQGNYINVSAMILAKHLRTAGEFNPNVTLKDWDMWKRIAAMGITAAKCPDTALYYRQHGLSQMNGGRGML